MEYYKPCEGHPSDVFFSVGGPMLLYAVSRARKDNVLMQGRGSYSSFRFLSRSLFAHLFMWTVLLCRGGYAGVLGG